MISFLNAIIHTASIPYIYIHTHTHTHTHTLRGFPGGSAGKESACSARDIGLIPGLGRFPGEGKGYPLQYSGLENSMDYIGPQRVRHN